MHITFVSNYINHHQVPISDELYRLSDGNYTFLQTEPMEEERIKMGWDPTLVQKPYVKLLSVDEESAKQLIIDSDVVIMGGTEKEELIIPRLEAGKFTIRYSERLYKTGRWKFVSPRGLKKKYHDHIRFRKSDVFLLCAGAYVAGDFRLIGAYPRKKLKFGYFPASYHYEDVHYLRKENDSSNKPVQILWAARFIDWKHPEMMVSLAKALKDADKNFHITMIGNGDLYNQTLNSIKELGLESFITLAGSMGPSTVREYMLKSDIFISTSDRQEGWGAVINEAMNSGCVTIASKDMGATPYLIKHGVNGYIYKACDQKDLLENVLKVFDSSDSALNIGTKAYETIDTLWNERVASKRLMDWINDPKHSFPQYENGPLSKA